MKRKQGFLFDYNFCIGCKACEISCQVYHNQDPDINWRHVDMMLIHEDEIEKEISSRIRATIAKSLHVWTFVP